MLAVDLLDNAKSDQCDRALLDTGGRYASLLGVAIATVEAPWVGAPHAPRRLAFDPDEAGLLTSFQESLLAPYALVEYKRHKEIGAVGSWTPQTPGLAFHRLSKPAHRQPHPKDLQDVCDFGYLQNTCHPCFTKYSCSHVPPDSTHSLKLRTAKTDRQRF